MTDIYVDDSKGEEFSGVSMFMEKETVLGIQNWNNISVCLKAQGATLVIGGDLTPEKIGLVERAMWYAREILLVGGIGIAFMMVDREVEEFLDIKLTKDQTKAINNIK